MQRSPLCRSRRELSNAYLLAKIGVDTAENEPLEVRGKIQLIIHLPPYRRPMTGVGVKSCKSWLRYSRELAVQSLPIPFGTTPSWVVSSALVTLTTTEPAQHMMTSAQKMKEIQPEPPGSTSISSRSRTYVCSNSKLERICF